MSDKSYNDEKETSHNEIPEKETAHSLDNIAYFVIFTDKTKILDDALALITNEALPREEARQAVLNAINSILIPITKDQLVEAKGQNTEETLK